MKPRRAAITVALASLLAAVTPTAAPGAIAQRAAPASATSSAAAGVPLRGLSDGRLLVNADPALRAAGIGVAQRTGARVARFPIGWSTVVRDDKFTRPDESALPLSDPANPTYRWERIDASLRDLAAAGLTPLAYLMAAPPWAQSAPRYTYATPGTWAPRPADLAAFASAVARRYDGTYPDPERPNQALPRIGQFQTWNEPNLARYLSPQWLAVRGKPQLFSARWYRRMHAAAYDAIHARQPDAVVGLAGLAPTGADVDGAGRVGPLRFLRSLMCVGIESPDTCGAPLPFDAIALHPLSVGDPDRPARNPDDTALADLEPKVAELLAGARAQGRLRAGPAPALWITELNWTTAGRSGIQSGDQAAVLGRAMLRLHQAGAEFVDWQFATDPPTDRTAGEERPAGLTEIADLADARRLPGAEKPFAAAFRFPVAAISIGGRQTYVWGMLPEGSTAKRATVEVLRDGRWIAVARPPVRDGLVSAQLAVPRGAMLRLRVGDDRSLPVRSQLRLALRRNASASDQATTATRSMLGTEEPLGIDPRPHDADGPGPVPELPPLLPGGTPPALSGRPIPPTPSPERPKRRLAFHGTAGDDVIIGSSGADRIIGRGGHDLIIGLGGDDRFDGATSTATIVRDAHTSTAGGQDSRALRTFATFRRSMESPLAFERLTIEGWRQFESVDIQFHPRLTVLTGPNGCGKTTLLAVLARHFSWSRPFVSTPRRTRRGRYSHLARPEIVKVHDGRALVGSLRYSDGSVSELSIPARPERGNALQEAWLGNQRPVEGLFLPSHRTSPGTYASVESIPVTPTPADELFNQYSNEMRGRWLGANGQNPALILKRALIGAAVFSEDTGSVQHDSDSADTWFGFQDVLRSLLPESLGFERLRVVMPDVFVETSSGDFVLDEMSGGLSAVVEIAWQIFLRARSSPDLCVIMDEPENHLHPSLQRELVPRLLKAFPNAQFTVATHSPFVATAAQDARVYALTPVGDSDATHGADGVAWTVGNIRSHGLDFLNEAHDADVTLRRALGVTSTLPMWAERRFDAIVADFADVPLTPERIDQLHERLAAGGLSAVFPDAVAQVARDQARDRYSE